jgi:small subunit ribosomal protein S18
MAKKSKKKECYFLANNIQDIDYKEVELLKKFMSSYHKIYPRRKTGLSAKYQRKVAKAIKQARIAGLLPFAPK